MSHQLDKTYNPKCFEERLYKEWEEKGYFQPSDDRLKKPFSIVIPPPNVTGQLHMGHALNNTLQDIIIRTKRMQGYNVLWVPGTDHAGIATQIKVEANLRESKGLSKYDVGREAFLELVWDWKRQYGNRIIEQLKKLGSSCDWTRERFTMDETCSKAVKKTFVSLYKNGLIYRGYRIINWCPNCKTALSDTEVNHIDMDGHFWHIRYPFEASDEYLEIATTRPETMLGDTAVAVNPRDERYTHLVGKHLILPLVGRRIPVIADEYVDMKFGTGCVKITPCHDPNDFEVGKRHGLEMVEILNGDGTINENGVVYEGMDRFTARKKIVSDLKDRGFLVKVKPHSHPVAHCYRCDTVVEPLSSRQWFVDMKPLAEPAIEVVKSGEIQYIPPRFSKNYLNWMENIQDWCISRQLWWGHRIPAYYCDDCGEIMVEEEDVHTCTQCKSHNIRQDEDVLDTWFSSALWPFSTLGWPDNTADLEYFYPTSVLVTAYDIITFWVSKMIFSGLKFMKNIPFPHVFIHGLVRDAQGRKMSKSLGNGIDPLDIVDQYGADALRFTLATGNSPGNDMRFSQERVEASRNFANKLWNAARFILMNLTLDSIHEPDTNTLVPEDKWILTQYNELVENITNNIEKYELGVAVSKLYDFIWDVFCDWYIELIKPRLFEKESDSNQAAQNTIAYVFTGTLKLLHPFMPFITEEIWLRLPHEGESIMVSSWPQPFPVSFPEEADRLEKVITAIRAIRNRRSEMNVPPSKKTRLIIETALPQVFEETEVFFQRLAGASDVSMVSSYPRVDSVAIPTDAATFHIPLKEMIDIEKEKERLYKEKKQVQIELQRVSDKLSNENFISRAPEKVVNGEKEKFKKYQDMLANIEQALGKLN